VRASRSNSSSLKLTNVRIILSILLACWPALAANRFVLASASGSANGTDWTNAYTSLGSALSAVVRGDTIYVGTGAYTCAPCTFSKADSGTTLITVKGAIAADHGTDIGWSSAFGVDVTPATFTTTANNAFLQIWSFQSDYWTIDSQVRSSLETGYGFVVNNAWPHAVGSPILLSTAGTPTTAITLRNVDIEGAGLDINNGETTSIVSTSCTGGTTANAVVNTNGVSWHLPYVGKFITVSGVTGGSGYNVTAVAISGVTDTTHFSYPATCSGSGTGGTVVGPFTQQEQTIRDISGASMVIDHCYIHNSSSDPIEIVSSASTSLTVQYSEINGVSSNGTLHAEGLAAQQANGLVFAYNVMRDFEGTAGLDVLCSTGCPLTSDNWQVYGNVFLISNGNPTGRLQAGDGIVFCQQTCTNFQIYNNSVINLTEGGNSAYWLFSSNAGSTCTGITILNNLTYSSTNGNSSVATGCTSYSRDYNSYLNSPAPASPSAHEVSDQMASNPFAAWTTGNFVLTGEQLDWTGGFSLSSPYNLDPNGNLRGADGTWERGACEFNFITAGSVFSSTAVRNGASPVH
jgi:hypothetical protein